MIPVMFTLSCFEARASLKCSHIYTYPRAVIRDYAVDQSMQLVDMIPQLLS